MEQTYSQRRGLNAALAAAQAASGVLMARFQPPPARSLKSWMKAPGALVTDADLASDKAIAGALRAAGVPGRVLSEESPSDAGVMGRLLSEESRSDGAPRQARGERPLDRPSRGERSPGKQAQAERDLTWLIDPLCGTVPYSTGMVHWGVNIALRRRGTLELGVVALPPLGETLAAIRGRGVTRNGRKWSPAPPYAVRPSTGSGRTGVRLSEVAVGLEIDGGETWKKLMRRGLGWVPLCGQVNTFASAAYPMGMVCLGRLSALVIYGVEPVHLAAGAAIALELGLPVTDGRGVAIDWSDDDELPVVVAGWPEIHRQLIAAMA